MYKDNLGNKGKKRILKKWANYKHGPCKCREDFDRCSNTRLWCYCSDGQVVVIYRRWCPSYSWLEFY